MSDPVENLKAKAAKVLERGVLVLPDDGALLVISCLERHAQKVRVIPGASPMLAAVVAAEEIAELTGRPLPAQDGAEIDQFERDLGNVIDERDALEDVLDKVKSELGITREWSNLYGYEEFLTDVAAKARKLEEQ